jgi:hypothetical protein
MITFKELYSNLDELKVVNISQRKKMALRMKRMTKSSAFKQKVARSKLKMADPAKLKVKATKLAKKKILDKVYPQYDDLPLQQKVQIDQKIQQKYSGIIAKLSQKLMITVKKNEKEKVKSARQAKKDA